jgi:hypothetical protein
MLVEKSRGRQGDHAAVVADKAQITFGRGSPGASPSKFTPEVEMEQMTCVKSQKESPEITTM